jgi:hypothetical protein
LAAKSKAVEVLSNYDGALFIVPAASDTALGVASETEGYWHAANACASISVDFIEDRARQSNCIAKILPHRRSSFLYISVYNHIAL